MKEIKQPLGIKVPDPMKQPVYTFDHEPTTMELRQTAVKAMADMLSIEWTVRKDLTYEGRNSGAGKTFPYRPGNLYHGLPYASGSTALPQWYEFYDPETGVLEFPGDGSQMRDILGNSCSSSAMWAWNTVCASVDGIFFQRAMLPINGAYPISPCTFDPSIQCFNDYSTQRIIEENGEDVIFQAYANVLPADALNSQPDNHVMMAIEKAHVVYKNDGQIDDEKSYIMIQDQRGGNRKTESKFYEVPVGDRIFWYSGRLSHKFSFRQLIDLGYIPMTTKEFTGERPYERAEVRYVGSTESVEDFLFGQIQSNYRLCVVKLMAVDPAGNKSMLDRILFRSADVADDITHCFPADRFSRAVKELLSTDFSVSELYVEAAVSTGEVFVPVRIHL